MTSSGSQSTRESLRLAGEVGDEEGWTMSALRRARVRVQTRACAPPRGSGNTGCSFRARGDREVRSRTSLALGGVTTRARTRENSATESIGAPHLLARVARSNFTGDFKTRWTVVALSRVARAHTASRGERARGARRYPHPVRNEPAGSCESRVRPISFARPPRSSRPRRKTRLFAPPDRSSPSRVRHRRQRARAREQGARRAPQAAGSRGDGREVQRPPHPQSRGGVHGARGQVR